MLLFIISLKIGEVMMSFSLLKAIDRASFYIYLIHPLTIFIINTYIANWGIINVDIAFMIRTAVTYIASIIVCHFFIKFKNGIVMEILKSIYGE